jgi:predicted RNA-binding Zn-ribbon protein involved in translation (DUF1610 family)
MDNKPETYNEKDGKCYCISCGAEIESEMDYQCPCGMLYYFGEYDGEVD